MKPFHWFRNACVALALTILLCTPSAQAAYGFTSFAALNANAAGDSSGEEYPALATDDKGVWIAVWTSDETLGGTTGTDTDVLFSRSTDNGATWSDRALLNTYGTSDQYGDFMPSIAADGNGNWVCTWNSAYGLNGAGVNDNEILAARSSDNGVTWSSPVIVNSNATTDGTAKDEYSTITTDGKGIWVVVWHSDGVIGDSTRADYEIRVARSNDNGAAWTSVANVNSGSDLDTADDMNPRVATDKDGNWIVVWESNNTLGDTVGDDYDILYAKSIDDGASWSNIAAISSDADTDSLNGSDTFAAVTADGYGNWVVAWESYDDSAGDFDILITRSDNNGTTWSAPAPLNSDAALDGSRYDNYVSLANDQHGVWLATWVKQHQTGDALGTDIDLMVSRSDDNGKTWSTLDAINGNGATDSGNEDLNAIASDAGGHWVAIAKSADSLGDTIGTDMDIIVTRTTIAIPTITITKPANGDVWTRGNKELIKWTTTGDSGEKVRIELLDNGAIVDTIKGSTKNDGKLKWKVPSSTATGKKFKVRVTSKSKPAITDDSDGKFQIK